MIVNNDLLIFLRKIGALTEDRVMDNIKDVLSELLETYTRSKFEIESILRIYEDRIKYEMGLIDIQNREESEKIIKELFDIQNQISVIIYKYNFPVSDFLADFIYDFDRQDIENINYILCTRQKNHPHPIFIGLGVKKLTNCRKTVLSLLKNTKRRPSINTSRPSANKLA